MANQNQQDNKKKKIKIIIAVLVIAVINFLLLRSCSSDSPLPDFSISDEEEDYNGQNKPKQEEQDFVKIPYYGNLWVSEEEPYVWFNNPEENNVYFSYEVLIDGEEVFHNEEYISPGKALKANLYDVLEKGQHPATVNISVIDENGAGCNGATQEAMIIVQ